MNAHLPDSAPGPAPGPITGKAAITIDDGAVEIDASIVGAGLGLEPQEVLGLMRANAITSVCEHGVDDDAGRYRLTFFHKGRRLRLIIDDCGRVVRRSTIDFGDRPLPAECTAPARRRAKSLRIGEVTSDDDDQACARAKGL